MPFYNRIKYLKPKEYRNGVIENLLRLKQQIAEDVPDKDTENNLLLATWNIRDLGKRERLRESLYYIAEVISSFDLVAVQEVNDLDELEEIMYILGPNWDYIATDEADRSAGGNGERMTFVYDKRKVWFQNIAGEIVLPPSKLISKATLRVGNTEVTEGKQFRRTPFVVSFQCGWFKFDLCTVHLYYGADYGDKLQERIEEISGIASYLGTRADKSLKDNKSLILLGDFNIVHPDHETMEALTSEGFVVPKKLQRSTNINRDKYYDQIAFKTKPEVLEYVEKDSSKPKNANAGVFDIYGSVYNKASDYYDIMKRDEDYADKTNSQLSSAFKTWRTYQMSDHNLLWVRLQVNDSVRYLENMKTS